MYMNDYFARRGEKLMMDEEEDYPDVTKITVSKSFPESPNRHHSRIKVVLTIKDPESHKENPFLARKTNWDAAIIALGQLAANFPKAIMALGEEKCDRLLTLVKNFIEGANKTANHGMMVSSRLDVMTIEFNVVMNDEFVEMSILATLSSNGLSVTLPPAKIKV